MSIKALVEVTREWAQSDPERAAASAYSIALQSKFKSRHSFIGTEKPVLLLLPYIFNHAD